MNTDLVVDDVDEFENEEVEVMSDESEDDSGESTDNVGDPSVEINVEELIHELEVEGLTKQLGNGQDARRRLEELMERKRARRELEDFDDYDF